VLKTGLEVTISCSEGEEGQVYAGLLPFEVKEVWKPAPHPHPNPHECGQPSEAFSLAAIDG